MTPGRYVFAPDGTPHYRDWHNLGSRDWTSDERDPEPDLGEWSGDRQRSDGSLAVPYPPARRIGRTDCLANGERFPLPVIDGFELVDGFDRRCWSKEFELFETVRIDVQSRDWQIRFAAVQSLLYTDATAATALLQGYLGPTATITTRADGAGIIPGTLIAVMPEQTIVVVSGTSNNFQRVTQALYIGNGLVNVGPFSTSLLWWQATTPVITRMDLAGVPSDKPITLVGHSYGGVIATLIAARLTIHQPDRNIQLLTFGMPKPGDARLSDILQTVRQTHIANEGDGVASIPATLGEILPANLGSTPWLQGQWGVFRRPVGQIVLAPDGTRTTSPESLVSLEQLIDWVKKAVAGTPIAPIADHDIDVYLSRLIAGS